MHICENVNENEKQNFLKEYSTEDISALSEFFKVLQDYTRLRILLSVKQGEKSVCEIASFLDMTHSAVSHQLRTLKTAGFLNSYKKGKNVFYSLKDNHIFEIIENAFNHIVE